MNQTTLPILSLYNNNLEKSDSLLSVFEDIHNHIYANDGLAPQQAFDEVTKILFIKIYDEKNKKFSFKIKPNEYTEIIEQGENVTFKNSIKELEKNTFEYFSSLFEINDNIKLKITTLAYIVNKLQNIDLLNSSNDIKGLAFQKFIHSSQRSGRGQFFTPEQVIKLCVNIIQPKHNEKVLDPACGSGGFLSYAMRYVLFNTELTKNDFTKFTNKNIFGFEISNTAAKIAKMMMILEGDGFSNIIQLDSLSEFNFLANEINKTCDKHEDSYEEFFDVILTNPPFGSQGKIVNKSILKNYDLGYKWNFFNGEWIKTSQLLNGQVPDILFIERCLKLLKPGGRMAIVLPNGDFENTSLSYVRGYILKKAYITAIIKLPQETFIPSGTGVKTSILFLEKRGATKKLSTKIFFGSVTKLGYLGNKNGSIVYKKDELGNILKDKNGNYLLDEDITEVVNSFLNYSQKKYSINENYFLIDVDELDLRFDYEYYKPYYRDLHKKMLNSGAVRLGDLIKLRKDKSTKLKQKNITVKYIELSDVSAQYNEIINYSELKVYELPSRASYELREGDIITAVAGNSIGTEKHVSALVNKLFEGAVCTNGFRVFITDKSKVNPFYLLYFLKTNYFLDQVFRFRTGAAIPSLLDEDLLNILVLLPEKKEQDRIGEIIKNGFENRNKFKEKIKEIDINI